LSDDITKIKVLGGVGGILAALFFIHWVLGIIGVVLLLIAFYSASEYYQEHKIFSNAIKYLVSVATSLAIIIGAAVYALLKIAGMGLLNSPLIWGGMSQREIISKIEDINWIYDALIYKTLVIMIVGIIVGIAVLIISGVFFKRTTDIMARYTGISLFSTAGTIYVIGAILAIIFVGLLLIFVSYLLLGIAFLLIKEKPKEDLSLVEYKY